MYKMRLKIKNSAICLDLNSKFHQPVCDKLCLVLMTMIKMGDSDTI